MVPERNDSGFANLAPDDDRVRMQVRVDGTPEADAVGTLTMNPNTVNHPSDAPEIRPDSHKPRII
jgi:hypothetical protein